MRWRSRKESTDGLRPVRLRHDAATVLSTGSFVQNGSPLLRGEGLIAGDVATPSFLVRPGNWGTMIMTGPYIEGPSIGHAISQGPALKHTKCAEIKIQSRNHAQNGEENALMNGETMRADGAVFSYSICRKPARLESSLSPQAAPGAPAPSEEGPVLRLSGPQDVRITAVAPDGSPEPRSSVLRALSARSEPPWGWVG